MNRNTYALLREGAPLIHAISNQVAANDCANLLLAIGARPMMACAPAEMEEIVSIANAVVLNLGTPGDEKYEACLIAGKTANRLGKPVILDPVGVGASRYRIVNTKRILDEVHPAIIRGNLGEVQALVGARGMSDGVDSRIGNQSDAVFYARRLAEIQHCTVLMSGPEDIVTDGNEIFIVRGGTVDLRRITGAGCMLSVVCGALSVYETPIDAALNAAIGWKQCASDAKHAIGPEGGIGHLHMALMDMAEKLYLSKFEDVEVERVDS